MVGCARLIQPSPTTRNAKYRRLLGRRILPAGPARSVSTASSPPTSSATTRPAGEATLPVEESCRPQSIRVILWHPAIDVQGCSVVGLRHDQPIAGVDPPHRALYWACSPLLPSEVAVLLAPCRRDRSRTRCRTCASRAASGARRGELGALRWTDVDLERGRGRHRSGGRARWFGRLNREDTKTHQQRVVSLDEATVTVPDRAPEACGRERGRDVE